MNEICKNILGKIPLPGPGKGGGNIVGAGELGGVPRNGVFGYDAAHAVTNPQPLWLCAQDLHKKEKRHESRSGTNWKGVGPIGTRRGIRGKGQVLWPQYMASMHEIAKI